MQENRAKDAFPLDISAQNAPFLPSFPQWVTAKIRTSCVDQVCLNVPTLDIISNEINFIGNLVGTYNDLVELMTLTAQGKVKLHTAVYPLDAALDAIHDLDSGKLRGRGILVPQA